MFEIQNLGKAYSTSNGPFWALRHVSLSLPDVGLIAIRGPSGSGKSTFLNLLSGLETLSEGTLCFNGEDLSSFRESQREDYRLADCGFVYQHFNLLEDLSVRENVALPLLIQGVRPAEAYAAADQLLQAHQLAPLSANRASALSGGEKQRVALLRALIKKPRVLFADEPTGALDRENEKRVMDELKICSSTSLVLLVTHNERIIEEYAEVVLSLTAGHLVGSVPVFPSVKASKKSKAPTRKRRWATRMLMSRFRQGGLKSGLAFFSGFLGYAAILLSLGYTAGSEAALSRERARSLLYTQARLSERKTFAIEGSPLSLVQESRPSKEKALAFLSDIPNVSLALDYSFFFPGYGAYSLDGKGEEPVAFSPISALTLTDRSLSFSFEGELPAGESLDYCLVNKEFADQFTESPLGKTLRRNVSLACTWQGVSEEVEIPYAFTISAVVKEFSFLNSPRVYCSSLALQKRLETLFLPRLSLAAGKDVSAASLVEEAGGLEACSSYGFLVYSHSEGGAAALEAVAQKLVSENEGLSLVSESYTINAAFSSLSSGFAMSLVPFLVIEVLGVAFILGSLAFSSFLERRKEAAILEALGAKKSDRALLYEGESVLLSLASAVAALLFSLPLAQGLSAFLEAKTGIADLVSVPYFSYLGIPFLPIIGLVWFALLVSALGSALPLEIASRKSLVGELRDE